jgi:hypothetical protein
VSKYKSTLSPTSSQTIKYFMKILHKDCGACGPTIL